MKNQLDLKSKEVLKLQEELNILQLNYTTLQQESQDKLDKIINQNYV